jgi:hypothetical protein
MDRVLFYIDKIDWARGIQSNVLFFFDGFVWVKGVFVWHAWRSRERNWLMKVYEVKRPHSKKKKPKPKPPKRLFGVYRYQQMQRGKLF